MHAFSAKGPKPPSHHSQSQPAPDHADGSTSAAPESAPSAAAAVDHSDGGHASISASNAFVINESSSTEREAAAAAKDSRSKVDDSRNSPSTVLQEATSQQTLFSMTADAKSSTTNIHNAEELIAALKKMSQGYSRILLLCSNFESSISDRSFFECFYYFVATCVKFAIPKPEAWHEIEKELCRLFRGNEFSEVFGKLDDASSPPEKSDEARNSPVHWSKIKFLEETVSLVQSSASKKLARQPLRTPDVQRVQHAKPASRQMLRYIRRKRRRRRKSKRKRKLVRAP